MASETQDPNHTWREKVRQMIGLRGLSRRDAAAEIGVGKGVVDHLLDTDSNTQGRNRDLIDVWMQTQAAAFEDATGLSIPGSLDYWRGRVEQVARHMQLVLDEQHGIAAEMRQEIEGDPPSDDSGHIEAGARPKAPVAPQRTARG